MLRLADHAPLAAPAVQRPVAEVLEHPCRLPRPLAFLPGPLQLRSQAPFQARVLRDSQHILHPLRLAPSQQFVAAEPAVPAQPERTMLGMLSAFKLASLNKLVQAVEVEHISLDALDQGRAH